MQKAAQEQFVEVLARKYHPVPDCGANQPCESCVRDFVRNNLPPHILITRRTRGKLYDMLYEKLL